MQTLYNQTSATLNWDMRGAVYTCEPWGPVDVPELLIDSVKSRGLPLAPVPVPSEARARHLAAQELDANRSLEFKAMQAEIQAAKERADLAVAELEKARSELSASKKANSDLASKLADTRRDLDAARSDKKAAEDLLTEQAQELAATEERAVRAEALLNQATEKKSAKK